MKQEEKELLLKDLCDRLPYGVKGNYQNSDDELLRKVTIMYRYLEPNGMVMTGDIKPYLFPLLSMTKEQKKFFDDKNIECDGWEIVSKEGSHYQSCYTDIEEWLEVIDWLNKNHFDYRGLIKKGLAIDATNLGIYK